METGLPGEGPRVSASLYSTSGYFLVRFTQGMDGLLRVAGMIIDSYYGSYFCGKMICSKLFKLLDDLPSGYLT